jgi:hypothetical protein
MEEFKPTFASVTTMPCVCGNLEHFAEDPDAPIIFDVRSHEYQFKYHGEDGDLTEMIVIYHCPFCGGAAPKTQRELLFARITHEEETRLAELLEPIKSIADAIATLGPPDYDGHSISRTFEKEGQPPQTAFQRHIRYGALSTIADIWINEREDGKIHWQLQGKPLAEPRSE